MDSSTLHTSSDPTLPDSCVMDRKIRSENNCSMIVVVVVVVGGVFCFSLLLSLLSRLIVRMSDVGRDDALGRYCFFFGDDCDDGLLLTSVSGVEMEMWHSFSSASASCCGVPLSLLFTSLMVVITYSFLSFYELGYVVVDFEV